MSQPKLGRNRPTRRGDHSSRPQIAPGLEQPTRGCQTACPCGRDVNGPGQPFPPIWPCFARGLPCPRCCHRGGGLLPHLFTLTKCDGRERRAQGFALGLPQEPATPLRALRAAPAVLSLWHFPLPRPSERGPLALPGALPCEVRTFLPPRRLATTGPAITRLTRRVHYIAISGNFAWPGWHVYFPAHGA
jgi:hypothetical protein